MKKVNTRIIFRVQSLVEKTGSKIHGLILTELIFGSEEIASKK